jgi:RNA methyltransferase, TrmH family
MDQRAQLITSVTNERVKSFRLLLRNGPIRGENRIAVEGVKLIEEAVRSRLKVDTVYVTKARDEEALVRNLLGDLKDLEIVWVSEKVMHAMTNTEAPQGIAALVRLPVFCWEATLASSPLILITCCLQDPGNLGAVFRSAEAFGAGALITTRQTVNPYNPKAVRASAGSVFRIPCFRQTESLEVIKDLKERGYQLLAATSRGGCDFRGVDYRLRTALLLGNEAHGLDDPVLSQAQIRIRIPMCSPVESLNVAVASSIILAEAARQRQT